MTALQGHIVCVTGAAGGLGQKLAAANFSGGCRLVLADNRRDEGEAAAADLRKLGAEARFAHLDLADPESVSALARSIEAEEGRLDGLVNNGAIATGIGGKMFDEIDIETWDRVMQVNVRGTWLVTRALAPLLAASGRGRIVNIASDTVLWGAPKLLAYVASKGAVIAMTRSLARELGPRGIGITCVAPGILRTQSTEYVPEERHRLYETGRAVPGPQHPEDLGGLVNFLLSPAALPLTGQLLTADNGFVFS